MKDLTPVLDPACAQPTQRVRGPRLESMVAISHIRPGCQGSLTGLQPALRALDSLAGYATRSPSTQGALCEDQGVMGGGARQRIQQALLRIKAMGSGLSF